MGSTIQKLISILTFAAMAISLSAHASPEYDRVYQLESLAWLPSHDNVDGIFTEYLDDLYTNYFKKQSRFVIKKLNRIQDVLGKSSLPYSELIQKPEILKKIAQKYRVESLIRTKIFKEVKQFLKKD